MCHIELFGLPAAGKTTLVETLLRGDRAAGQVIVAPLTRAPVTLAEKMSKRFRDLVSVSSQLLSNPAKSHRIWRACRAFKQPSAILWLRMYLSCLRVDWLARRADATASEDRRLVILDQGIYQAVWSMALRAEFDSKEELVQACRQLLACLAVPAMVIFVDTPADVARQRLASEPESHGRLPKLLKSDPNWMLRTEETLETLWRIADNESRIRTLRYTPASNALDDLERAIRRLSSADEPPDA